MICYVLVLAFNSIFITIPAFYTGLFYECVGMLDHSCTKTYIEHSDLPYGVYIKGQTYPIYIVFGMIMIILAITLVFFAIKNNFKKKKLFITIIICLSLFLNPITFILFRTINSDYYNNLPITKSCVDPYDFSK